MNAPNCPPNVPTTGLGPVTTPAPAGGPNPALDQLARGRRSMDAGATADAVDDTRNDRPVTLFWGDLFLMGLAGPPMRSAVLLVDDTTVNADPTAGLPGRIPPTAWDGEPGPASPTTMGTW